MVTQTAKKEIRQSYQIKMKHIMTQIKKQEKCFDEIDKILKKMEDENFFGEPISFTRIQFLQFGSLKVQQLYKELCEEINMNFEDFKDQLVEKSGKNNYSELKEYWIAIQFYDAEDINEDYWPTWLDKVLIIDFGDPLNCMIIDEEYECFTNENGIYFEGFV